MSHTNDSAAIKTSIVPWITVRNGEQAVSFYKTAFGAVEVYRLNEEGAGVVVMLSVAGAEFWLSDGTPDVVSNLPVSAGGSNIRMILTTADPDALFDQALK